MQQAYHKGIYTGCTIVDTIMSNPKGTKPIIVSLGVYNRLMEHKNNGQSFSRVIEGFLDRDDKLRKIIRENAKNDVINKDIIV